MMETIEHVDTVRMIHESRREQLEDRVARVNKRARKLGVPELKLQFTGVYEDRPDGKTALGQQKYKRFIEAVIHGQAPKLPGGWRLVAVIDHREERPITSVVPGEELTPGQRERGPICDHCGKVRRRADTFVLRDDEGKVVQVGRQCLGDFLGASVNSPEALLSFFMASFGMMDDEDLYLSMSGRMPDRLNVAEVVLLAGAVIDTNGWVSRARWEELGQIPTASRVHNIIRPPKFTGYDAAVRRAEYEEWLAEVRAKITPELEAERDAALQWVATEAAKPKASEFMRDLDACCAGETLAIKYIGRVSYIMAGYRKAQERLIEAERKRALWADSTHVGEPKQRLEADLEMIDYKVLPDNGWGESYLYTFKDGDGNCIKWFASDRYSGWEIGQTRHVKMTVKKHDEFNGVLQTVVNRVMEYTPKVKCTMSGQKVDGLPNDIIKCRECGAEVKVTRTYKVKTHYK